VGLATAALRRVGVTSEYALRAEVSEDRVQVHAVVNDPSGDLRRAAPVLEERFGEWAVSHGYGVERFERRPGLSELKGAVRKLRGEVREEARALPAAERRELAAAADAMAESVFGRAEEAEPEL
jgi:hypothetical protein